MSQASKKILKTQYDNGIVREALHYYAKTVLPKVLPIFPALIYLSSKTVGATPENANPVAAAMMLITASGDIHDDIVDNSKAKFACETVFGKYGRDIALLAGDVLLTQGSVALQNGCSSLTCKQRKTIGDLVTEAMFEISKAEAIETSLWHKAKVSPEEYFEVIRHKGVVAELHCRICGLIGGADKKTIEYLASYGRTIGVLATVKEEFVDMSNSMELLHRINYELPPYPMLCSMQNKVVKEKFEVAKQRKFSFEDLLAVVDAVLGSSELAALNAEFREFGRKELERNLLLKGNGGAEELRVLLEALTIELMLV